MRTQRTARSPARSPGRVPGERAWTRATSSATASRASSDSGTAMKTARPAGIWSLPDAHRPPGRARSFSPRPRTARGPPAAAPSRDRRRPSRRYRRSCPRAACRSRRSARPRAASGAPTSASERTCAQCGSPSATHRILSSAPLSSCISEHADRARVHPAARERRLVEQDDRVGVVAVAGSRPVDEAVLVRVEHRRREHAVEPDRAGPLVELVLVARSARDLDDDLDVSGNVRRRLVPARGGRLPRLRNAPTSSRAGLAGRADPAPLRGRPAAPRTPRQPASGAIRFGLDVGPRLGAAVDGRTGRRLGPSMPASTAARNRPALLARHDDQRHSAIRPGPSNSVSGV